MNNMPSHSQQLFISSCQHAEHISCKINVIYKLQSVVLPTLENVASPLYHKLSVALNFLLMSFSQALSQHSVPHMKNFLSRAWPAPNLIHTGLSPNTWGRDKSCFRNQDGKDCVNYCSILFVLPCMCALLAITQCTFSSCVLSVHQHWK